MVDAHVHFLHGHGGDYTEDCRRGFVDQGRSMALDGIYLLEHTHQFRGFEAVYEPVRQYSGYQREWIARKMDGSSERYLDLIDRMRDWSWPMLYPPESRRAAEAKLAAICSR
jgi:histidinol-phosphatase (PHP family)